TFLQALKHIEHLRETAHQLGWSLDDSGCSEDALTATFFWGYPDRLLRRGKNNKLQSVHRFHTEFQRDSLHHPCRGSGAELVLCAGLIWTNGDPTGSTRGTTFNAISPEALQDLLGDDVGFVIDAHGDNGQLLEACDVWYWGEALLATRLSPMPEGS